MVHVVVCNQLEPLHIVPGMGMLYDWTLAFRSTPVIAASTCYTRQVTLLGMYTALSLTHSWFHFSSIYSSMASHSKLILS